MDLRAIRARIRARVQKFGCDKPGGRPLNPSRAKELGAENICIVKGKDGKNRAYTRKAEHKGTVGTLRDKDNKSKQAAFDVRLETLGERIDAMDKDELRAVVKRIREKAGLVFGSAGINKAHRDEPTEPAKAAAETLPKLQGSEKQVKSAEDIRKNILDAIDKPETKANFFLYIEDRLKKIGKFEKRQEQYEQAKDIVKKYLRIEENPEAYFDIANSGFGSKHAEKILKSVVSAIVQKEKGEKPFILWNKKLTEMI